MSNPVIADNRPKRVILNKGEEYYFCVCGRSSNQPFCDGSHKKTLDELEGKIYSYNPDGTRTEIQ